MTTTTAPAPAFTVSRRSIRGRVHADLTAVPDGVDVITVATIVSARAHGTGSSRRLTLGLAADNGATAVATVDADRLQQIPDFLRTRGARVRVWGVVRVSCGVWVIQVIGIAPQPAD